MNAVAIINEINETSKMNEMTAIIILSMLLLVVCLWIVWLRNSSKTKDTITTLTNKINVLENITFERVTLFEEQNKKINDMDEIIFTLMEQNKLLIKSHDEIIKDTNDSHAITNQEFNKIKYKITGLETQFQESKDKITGLETEINILNTHNTNINDQLINFKELITDHVTHTELEQTVNRCVAFQHLSTVTNCDKNPFNSDISISGANSTTLNFKRPVLYYPNDNPNHGLQNLHENNYYLRTIKCNGIYYNFIPHNGYIFNSNSEKIDRGDSSYRPAGKYDLKTHSIELFNFKL